MNLFTTFCITLLTGVTIANSNDTTIDEALNSSKDKIENKKEVSKTVNLQGHEVTGIYRGMVIVIYSDGTTFRKIQ